MERSIAVVFVDRGQNREWGIGNQERWTKMEVLGFGDRSNSLIPSPLIDFEF
jgi:hypothetical protein